MGYDGSSTNSTRELRETTFLKNALEANEPGIGMWLTVRGSAVAASIGSVPGFNWFLIDAEHGQITDEDYYELCLTTASRNISPIIRVPYDSEWMIKRALDAGAHGVMTPMCHDAETARRIVSFSKYAPKGTRGYGPLFTHHVFPGTTSPTYERSADASLLVILQIESRPGTENVDEIAAVEGVDVLFVGPFDLAKNMGVTWGGDEHEKAIAGVVRACKKHGKKSAIFCTSGTQARARLQQGFDMVSICTDMAALTAEMGRQVGITLGRDA